MNKRQRKKAKAKPLRWVVRWRPVPVRLSNGLYASVTGLNTVTVSNSYNPKYTNVQDPNSYSIMEKYLGAISPSRRLNDWRYTKSGVSFARIFSGDQSRRDRFPSPYLPDGSENPAYAEIIDDGLIPSRLPEDEDHSYEQMARRYYGWP